MSDAQLRELERRAAAAPGDVAAAAALLTGRLRAGTLTRERLELAAYCGHETARAAVGRDEAYWIAVRATGSGEVVSAPDEHRGDVPDFARWVQGLSRWDGALVRAAVAAGWVALGAAEARARCRDCGGQGLCVYARDGRECDRCRGLGVDPNERDMGPARRALEAAEEWLACLCAAHQGAWAAAWNALDDAKDWIPAPGPPGDGLARRGLANVHGVVRECAVVVGRGHEVRASLARERGEPVVRRAICAALVAWALA